MIFWKSKQSVSIHSSYGPQDYDIIHFCLYLFQFNFNHISFQSSLQSSPSSKPSFSTSLSTSLSSSSCSSSWSWSWSSSSTLLGDLLRPFVRIRFINNRRPIMNNWWEWVIYNRRKRVPFFSPFFGFCSFFVQNIPILSPIIYNQTLIIYNWDVDFK